jgi:hypothetical protein
MRMREMSMLFLLSLTSTAALGADTSRPITNADGIVAVYAENGGWVPDAGPKLIVAAWSDGYVVWSGDRLKGGAPYFAGQVAPTRVSAVLTQIERDGFFEDKELANVRVGPDASSTIILLKKGARQLALDSWHELAEADGRVVARSFGLTGLTKDRRLEVLRKEPAEYLYYRAAWGELRVLSLSLIPAQGRPVSGQIEKRAGILRWREASAK